jgi:hypothetical protein
MHRDRRELLGSGKPPQADVSVAWAWKYGCQLLRGRKVDWIIETRIVPNATLELACTAVDLTEQLNL